MTQSTGPPDREDFQGVNGVVLPNEMIGDMILTFFVDLSKDVVFIIVQGGFESYYFDQKNLLYHIENINKVGVMLGDYMDGIDELTMLLGNETTSPLPPYEQARQHLLTRARVQRSQTTN